MLELRLAHMNRRLQSTNDDHRDFLWYILKQQDKFELREEEIIANSALFMLVNIQRTSRGTDI